MSQLEMLIEIGNRFLNALKYIVPGILVIVGILFTYNMIKTGEKLVVAVNKITSKPGFIIFCVLVILMLLYIWVFIGKSGGLYYGVI